MPFDDLREFLAKLEAEGELRRVAGETDWNLEIGAITRRGLDLRGPALLFERIKDYPASHSIVGNLMGPTKPTLQGRVALAMDMPKDTPTVSIIEEFVERCQRLVPPEIVKTGPCKENILTGDRIDLTAFPAPMVHQGDGGRYLGTWHINITKDPDDGHVNWGMYRHMIHDRQTLGWLANPGQHGPATYYQKYEARGKRMPMAIAIGTEPICSILAGSPVPKNIGDAELAGAIRGTPVQLVKCETVDLEVPASSEIVIEGYVEPGERALEGEFGEYTGYTAGGRMPRPVLHVTCVTHRDSPILTVSNMGKPWDDFGVISSITVSAFLAKELRERGVSFKAVYVPAPVLAVIISGKPQYAGYVHTIASSIWSAKAGLYRPYIFYVGEDVDVTNAEDVFWCLTTRLHPGNGIHTQENSPSIPLWPFLSPKERETHLGARVVFDATFPSEWGQEETPKVVDFEHSWPEEVRRKALEFWAES